jgi:hypothetical protein
VLSSTGWSGSAFGERLVTGSASDAFRPSGSPNSQTPQSSNLRGSYSE